MASSLRFTCDSCGFSLEAWDEGNPYIEFPLGKRHYWYHPGEMEVIREVTRSIVGHDPSNEECESALENYAGNEPDYICRSCCKETRFDPDRDAQACTHCGSADVEEMYTIGCKQCIQCDGTFSEGQPGAVS